MKRLAKIIHDLRTIRERCSLVNLDDKTIFEQACGFRRGELVKKISKKNLPNKEVKDFKPTEEQLLIWKDEDVTEAQKKVLLKMGFKQKEIENMSKLNAYEIINNCKKENI